jgi:PIN domain nuclease of toxin-antitoxin system
LIHIDTHIAVWTHLGQSRRLSSAAKRALASGPVGYSPMVRLELHILHERRKLPSTPEVIIADLVRDFDAVEYDGSFANLIRIGSGLQWTTDPFDRLIVATAMTNSAKLITADGEIIEHFADAVW